MAFKALEDAIQSLQKRLGLVEGRTTATESAVDAVEASAVSLDTRLDTAESTLTSLDTRLDTLEADSGWIAVSTFSNSFTGSSVAYRKVGGIVYLRGELLRATAPSSSTTAFTLPAGYRPTARLRQLNWANAVTEVVGLTVNTTGNVDILCATVRSATPGYHINTSFPAA